MMKKTLFTAIPISYFLYAMLVLGILYAVFRLIRFYIREKRELRSMRTWIEQQVELNNVRTNFFNDVSREFRTPLNLVIGPLKRLINEDRNEERKKAGLLILRNAERLQRLIDQIIDLNKIDEGEMKLHVQSLEVISFVSKSIGIFTELIRQKHISLTYAWKLGKTKIWYDPVMLNKCLTNIMYNAFKSTPEGGKIHVELSRKDDGNILLTVSDTGTDISRETTGAKISIRLTKHIVELHKGDVTVESEEGKGSRIHLTIIAGNKHFTAKELEPTITPCTVDEEEEEYMQELRSLTSKPRTEENTPPIRPTLLLVEDNSDMRNYIRQELSDLYDIEEAANGKEGLDKAQLIMPDLILTDVMMPEMSGTDLCRILKADPETCHIPIIILTAHDDLERRLEGVESGADSFITKPFSTKYLQIRIEKLIELRNKMKERFSKSIYMDAQQLTLTSMDERLVQRAIDYVRANIENTNMSVEHMSRELNMSRTHLHRKLKALTGQSPVEFIKMIRMKQAAYLLTTGKLTVAEVGYKVGYNAPSYFSSSFTSHFGMPPKVYMEMYGEH